MVRVPLNLNIHNQTEEDFKANILTCFKFPGHFPIFLFIHTLPVYPCLCACIYIQKCGCCRGMSHTMKLLERVEGDRFRSGECIHGFMLRVLQMQTLLLGS